MINAAMDRVRRARPRRAAVLDELPAVLIVSSRHRLWQRYGPDGLASIEGAVADLVDAMGGRGLVGTPVYVDDSPLLSNLGVLPAEAGAPESVARVVRTMAERMAWLDELPHYVLILGDDGIVPFFRGENPSPDSDEYVLTDHPYAAEPDRPFSATRAVGRLPDGSLETLVGSLRAAAAAHRRLAERREPALAPAAFGYSASVWKRAARTVYGAVGDPKQVRLSPPLANGDAPRPDGDGPRFRYFNLHGLADAAEWFGQRDPVYPADYPFFPVALRPADVAPAPGGLVFSEACYGAHIDGRGVDDSMALTCLAGGALGFVGATGVAYGGLDGPLVAADFLAFRFWEAILDGAPAGLALNQAKRQLVNEAIARQGYLDAEDEKAVHNFVLYGDPSLVHHVPSKWAEDAAAETWQTDTVEWAGPVAKVGTLPVQPKHISHCTSESHDSASLVAYVRKTVARRLPEFGAADVHVATEPAPRRVGPKSAHTADASAGPTVVTLTKSLLMCTGQSCREVVRVTVGSGGRIRKVTVSR